jgi:tight adherence protein C
VSSRRRATGSPGSSSESHPKTTWTASAQAARRRLGARLARPVPAPRRLGIGGLLLGMLFGGAARAAQRRAPLRLAFAGLGFLAPTSSSARRPAQARPDPRQLPDALDLLAVSVEAGLGFDGAISKLIESHGRAAHGGVRPDLNEIRIGESRQDALKKLAAARRHAGDLRLHPRDHPGRPARHLARPDPARAGDRHAPAPSGRRRGEGDEGPIKMLFPTVLFIFPAMFLVILGPAFLNLSKIF